MTGSLFDLPERDELWVPEALVVHPVERNNIVVLPQTHPYARYGLAVTLYQKQLAPPNATEELLRVALAEAIESGLEHFRLRTDDTPAPGATLRYRYIPLATLQREPDLIYTKGMNDRGLYLAPTITTCNYGQSQAQIIPRAFEKAREVLDKLRAGAALFAPNKLDDLSRSFVPVAGERNNGAKDSKLPRGTLFEVACCIVTSFTPLKPAAFARVKAKSERDKINTTIVPDLELEELMDFVALFDKMRIDQLSADLMQVQLYQPPASKAAATPDGKAQAKATKRNAKPQSDEEPLSYERPRLHAGNYPFAPRDANAFGAVGLLGAIGRWARTAEQVPWAERVLESLAQRPLYIVSYDNISVVRFGHHVVSLSIQGRLSEMLEALWRETQLYADLESPRPRRDTPAYQLFYLQTSRFLQTFTAPAFADFLAARAEYPPQLQPLFEEYFMGIDAAIVQSAGVLGQWLNRTAYFVADSEIETTSNDRQNKVRKTKAKILVEFESAAMSAKSPTDMLSRISVRAGRLLNDDAPAGAKRFMDAVASGEVTQQEATHLLVAYMRLRAPARQTDAATTGDAPATTAQEATQDNENNDSIGMA